MLGSVVREIAVEGRKSELFTQGYPWVGTRANDGHTNQPPPESLADPTPPLEGRQLERQLIHCHHRSWQSSEVLTQRKKERKVWLTRGTVKPQPSLQPYSLSPPESEPPQVPTSPNAETQQNHWASGMYQAFRDLREVYSALIRAL